MKNIQLYVIGLLLLVVVAAMWRIEKLSKDVSRLGSNQEALFAGVKHSQDSLIASVGRVSLTADELKQKYPDIKEELKAMGIRLCQVESISKTGVKIQANLMAQVRDSIVKGDTLMRQLYKDKFISFESLLNKKQDTAYVKLEMPVKLEQVVSRYKDGFFLWKPFKKWKYKQTIKSDNPYAKIEYNEYVTIQR